MESTGGSRKISRLSKLLLLVPFLCVYQIIQVNGPMNAMKAELKHGTSKNMGQDDRMKMGNKNSLFSFDETHEIKDNAVDGSIQSSDNNAQRTNAKGRLRKIKKATTNSPRRLNGTHCFPWNEEADKWWEMHPEYDVVTENDNELCFAPIRDSTKAAFFKDLHGIQYNASNCQNVFTKKMWSSGFGADFSNVADGLAYALETKRPFQITMKEGEQWHYAAFKKKYREGREPVCPSADMFCYFLPLGICKAGNIEDDSPFLADRELFIGRLTWLREFATRPKQWLRQRVMKYISMNRSNFTIGNAKHSDDDDDDDDDDDNIETTSNLREGSKCAAIHIRRTDVVLHKQHSRKYFSVQEYLDKLKAADDGSDVKNIYLFTDDANAIDEALKFHSDYNWMYLKKKRHRGSEGGWENQLPGDSPTEEVIAMLAEFRLAQECDFFVHTKSAYATVIYDSMKRTGKHINRLEIDEGSDIFHLNHTDSENALKSLLEKKRVEVFVGEEEGDRAGGR